MKVALNKNALKQERDKLAMYRRFLPSLDLKRRQLVGAWRQAQQEMRDVAAEIANFNVSMADLLSLLGSSTVATRDLSRLVRTKEVLIGTENVVGVRLPRLDSMRFERAEYSTLTIPFWVDQVVDRLEDACRLKITKQIALRREELLETATRRVTQRVNLFEKVLIPGASENIKRIRVALSDQDRA
ncbi:MAG TPA: V-type ATP synthase subunit D, partial [Planctomycetaceae bacterium]|nr:V-type ATP synthase subunit D [Planctomycetaceae bacterium]